MRGLRFWTGGLLVLAGTFAGDAARAQDSAPASGESVILIAPELPANLVNPAGRAVVLTAPIMDGEAYLGDATLTLGADGSASFSAARLLALLDPRLNSQASDVLHSRLAANGRLTNTDLTGAGITIRYNPQTLQVEMDIAASSRAASVIALGSALGRTVNYMEPANFSAYLNVRGSLDWVQQGQDDADEGLSAPVMFIDGAARWKGVVLEGELNLQPDAPGADYQRRGTRLVYDDRDRLVRWSAGDQQTVAYGFQSAPEIAGLGVSRRYSILDPQTVIRPRGSRSFQLDRRSMVEVRINGQLVRRIELDPGVFDLQDFPFAQGANDVELTITDDTGRTERANFNIFLDQAQLAEGLSEFAFYAGALAPLGFHGPVYSDTPAFSGFYRRGISDRLTLGANLQADTHGWMGGGEIVLATPIGSLAGLASASHVEDVGGGWAGLLNFQRTFASGGISADTLTLSVEARSKDFAPIGNRLPENPYSLIVGASYGRSLTYDLYAGIDARYSRGRGDEVDVQSLRGMVSWNIAPNLSFTGDVTYEKDIRGTNLGTLLSLTYRLGRRSSLRGDYDSRYDRARVSYQTFGGTGLGSYTLNADVEHSDIGTGASVNANYYGNRAELGFSHFGIFERDLGASTGQRSSLRFGTSLAMADGAATVGRPIYDAFALVKAHRAIRDNEILVDPTGDSASASTGALGTALQPSLSSYSDRSLIISAPEAAINLDLGQGAFRLFPPYRAGYLLTVGSDYNVSATGRLLDAAGQPVSLVSGTAHELAHPDREPLALFTNRDGRFGLIGLAPGRWRIELVGAEGAVYEIEIPADQDIIQLGEVRPGS
ncbi:fimbrial biogenesis outer membrane usher protein [Altererythrobacter sp. Root672]|uniref:fimbrial biogenesis outer membrane usher protein n=1 Tax=Altererythrobacter sp. Root672 TaxID=1736584 RepID=UPI000AD092D1|nr:fimbrial biogenesis outer membrane usher protein [Altererythrobacter sp. Root672]